MQQKGKTCLDLAGKTYLNCSNFFRLCCKLIYGVKFLKVLKLQLFQIFYNNQLLHGAYKLKVYFWGDCIIIRAYF